MTCHQPKNPSATIPQCAHPRFWRVLGSGRRRNGRSNGCKGNPLTAKDDGGDRRCPWHMKLCGHKIQMAHVLLFEFSNQSSEIGDGIDGLAINMKLLGWNLGGLEDFKGLVGTNAGGDPDR